MGVFFHRGSDRVPVPAGTGTWNLRVPSTGASPPAGTGPPRIGTGPGARMAPGRAVRTLC
ncbi:Uncharacterised protein [Bordetella pertussis]|nr:Uncharacterised protein [Bordetella pertussis]